jgi:hypothetical protein
LIGFPESLGVSIRDTFKIERPTILMNKIMLKISTEKKPSNKKIKTSIMLLLSRANPMYLLPSARPNVLK